MLLYLIEYSINLDIRKIKNNISENFTNLDKNHFFIIFAYMRGYWFWWYIKFCNPHKISFILHNWDVRKKYSLGHSHWKHIHYEYQYTLRISIIIKHCKTLKSWKSTITNDLSIILARLQSIYTPFKRWDKISTFRLIIDRKYRTILKTGSISTIFILHKLNRIFL